MRNVLTEVGASNYGEPKEPVSWTRCGNHPFGYGGCFHLGIFSSVYERAVTRSLAKAETGQLSQVPDSTGRLHNRSWRVASFGGSCGQFSELFHFRVWLFPIWGSQRDGSIDSVFNAPAKNRLNRSHAGIVKSRSDLMVCRALSQRLAVWWFPLNSMWKFQVWLYGILWQAHVITS